MPHKINVNQDFKPYCKQGHTMEYDLQWNNPTGWETYWCEVCDVYTTVAEQTIMQVKEA